MLLASAGMGLAAAGLPPVAGFFASERIDGILPGFALPAASATFAFLAGVLLLLLRAYLGSSEKAARNLADAVRSHGEDLPRAPDFPVAAEAAKRRLDRYREEVATAVAVAREEQENRVREITEAHNDLITHHKFTKRMLQSCRADEVLETLLKGVRDGLGFTGAIIGILDPNGDILFPRGGNGEGRPGVRIPGWDERALLARTIWSGSALWIPSLDGQRHLEEERPVLGEGPAFLVPITRKPNRKCSETKACGIADCPAYDALDARCWAEGRGRHPKDGEEKRKECVRCEMFTVSAVLVARSTEQSRSIRRESTGSIVTLVNEAALALEVAELNENTRKMSITDGLTGLANHREFYQSLRRELNRAKRYGHSVSLLMVDVDDFKKFNDRYGHLAGDDALKKIADLLRGCVRANDIVARYGGEEFGIILPESTPAGALMLAERIKTEMVRCRFLESSDEEPRLTVSIGIYSAETGDVSEERMVKFADEAAYLAKNSGKNRVVVKSHA